MSANCSLSGRSFALPTRMIPQADRPLTPYQVPRHFPVGLPRGMSSSLTSLFAPLNFDARTGTQSQAALQTYSEYKGKTRGPSKKSVLASPQPQRFTEAVSDAKIAKRYEKSQNLASEIEKLPALLDALATVSNTYQEDLEAKRSIICDLQLEVGVKNTQIKNLEAQLENTKLELRETSARLLERDAALQSSKMLQQELQTRLDNSKILLEQSQLELQENINKNTQVEYLEAQLEDTKLELRETSVLQQELQTRLDNSKIQLEQTQLELSFNQQFQIEVDYEKNMASLRKDLEQYRAELAIIGQEAEELAVANKDYKQSDAALRLIIEDALAALEDVSNRGTVATDEDQIQTGDADQAYDVPYFKNALRSETEMLQALCSKWKIEAKTFSQLPDETQGLIRTAIGQSELLMAQRFNQFNDLIDDCQFKRGPKERTTNDLAGYWDMVMYQVKDVKERFNQLEVHWLEEKPLIEKTKDTYSAVVIRDPVTPCRTKSMKIPVPRTKVAEFKSKFTKSYLIKV